MDEDAKLFYHGTTNRYHDQRIKEDGVYSHDFDLFRKKISLDVSPATPMAYAIQRAGQYINSKPILLVINASKVKEIGFDPCLSCDFLRPEWYKILNVEVENGKFSLNNIKELEKLEKEVLNL